MSKTRYKKIGPKHWQSLLEVQRKGNVKKGWGGQGVYFKAASARCGRERN
jgi:hypothetical protein